MCREVSCDSFYQESQFAYKFIRDLGLANHYKQCSEMYIQYDHITIRNFKKNGDQVFEGNLINKFFGEKLGTSFSQRTGLQMVLL